MKKAFYNCFILDGTEAMAPLPGHAVLVKDDRITAILPEAEVPAEGWERIDLGGQFLLPA